MNGKSPVQEKGARTQRDRETVRGFREAKMGVGYNVASSHRNSLPKFLISFFVRHASGSPRRSVGQIILIAPTRRGRRAASQPGGKNIIMPRVILSDGRTGDRPTENDEGCFEVSLSAGLRVTPSPPSCSSPPPRNRPSVVVRPSDGADDVPLGRNQPASGSTYLGDAALTA